MRINSTPDRALRISTDQRVTETPAISVYPNPAGSWANFLYDLKGTPEQAFLAIRDITGKEVARIPLDRTEGQTVWDTRAVAPGTYTVELVNEGASQGTLKLVVKQ